LRGPRNKESLAVNGEKKRIESRETEREREKEGKRPKKQGRKELRGIGSFLLINALHER